MIENAPLALNGQVTSVGWQLPEGMTFNEWCHAGELLSRVERSVPWWIGDWWRYGERYGERVSIVTRDDWKGPNHSTCRDYGAVAEKFHVSDRSDTLTFLHHRFVRSLPLSDAKLWLRRAEAGRWSARDLRAALSRSRFITDGAPERPGRIDDLFAAAEAGRRWSAIYVDPPWAYDNQGTRASTDKHYPTMTVEALCELPIGDLANDSAHLHLWTTNGFLFECQKIFDAWRFEFKSSFIWVKSEIGIGNYWRNAHEFLLTAVRGDARQFNDHNLRSWIECSRSEHSDKPDQVRSFIERASPGPRLELFARRATPGWNYWGDEIEHNLFSHTVAA